MGVSPLMIFPLTMDDLSILLAATAILLLVTSELISSYSGKVAIKLDKKRLRRVGIIFSIFFLLTVGIRMYEIILEAI